MSGTKETDDGWTLEFPPGEGKLRIEVTTLLRFHEGRAHSLVHVRVHVCRVVRYVWRANDGGYKIFRG